MKEALFWSAASDNNVRCRLCPHDCLVAEGKTGTCKVRKNISGKLYSMVYGQVAAIHPDPIEKKPLYHFLPGRTILSVGTFGCNLRCTFCQNHTLSQNGQETMQTEDFVTPSQLAGKANHLPGNTGIAYTYNEPAVFYEFMLDTARIIRAEGLKNVMVSNGYIRSEPLNELLPLIDAFNIDLKSFSDTFYKKQTGGSLYPVLETIKTIVRAGKHLEITFLVIPGHNDSAEEFDNMTDWIKNETGSDVPFHLSRYFPAFKMAAPPTPPETLFSLATLAKKKLNYVYTGNIRTENLSSTYCPVCRELLISRDYYTVRISGLTPGGKCRICGTPVPVMFK